jgi:hypothetical protein
MIYHRLKDRFIQCDRTLGVDSLKRLHGASEGASGAKLLKGRMRGYLVVIKVFPVDCPYKYIRGRQRRNNGVRDYGDFEIGTGLMLTDTFILTGLTQNVVTCYNYTICNYSYDVDVSRCHRTSIPRQPAYPIVNDNSHPLHSYYDDYFKSSTSDNVETPYRDDVTRYFMVEKCIGDLQGFISEDEQLESLIDTLNYVVLMVFHTLLLFDNVLDRYSHNDLGLRNVLYVRDSRGSNDTYNRYIFPDGVVDIPTNVIIPKIWDFAYVRYNNVEMYKKYYNYIDDLPTYQGIKEEFRDNDVFIFLQDMDGFLRKNNIADNIFNNLDLQRIRDAVSNTDAINEYFRQNPILSNYEPRHRIIHTFETN